MVRGKTGTSVELWSTKAIRKWESKKKNEFAGFDGFSQPKKKKKKKQTQMTPNLGPGLRGTGKAKQNPCMRKLERGKMGAWGGKKKLGVERNCFSLGRVVAKGGSEKQSRMARKTQLIFVRNFFGQVPTPN